MKRLFIIIFMALLLAFPMGVFADDVYRTFRWTQNDYDKVNYWVLYWGLTSGGPYTVDDLRINKSVLDDEQAIPVTIQYPANAKTKYYFVLVAFNDPEHYSGNSNEVFVEVDFTPEPTYTPQSPVELNVIITPASEPDPPPESPDDY